jgi:hypothetical protein
VAFIDRVVEVRHPENLRLTYGDFFRKIAEVSAPNDINVIANTDIFFNDTIAFAHTIRHGEVFVLSRRDLTANGCYVLEPNPSLNDAWIIRGVPKDSVAAEIEIGRPSCDNRIAFELAKVGYSVVNVGHDIKAFHLHKHDYRTWKCSEECLDKSIQIVPPRMYEGWLMERIVEDASMTRINSSKEN